MKKILEGNIPKWLLVSLIILIVLKPGFRNFDSGRTYNQLLTSNGTSCVPPGDAGVTVERWGSGVDLVIGSLTITASTATVLFPSS